MLKQSSHCLRKSMNIKFPSPKSEIGRLTFRHRAAIAWNSLPDSIKKSSSLECFKKRLRSSEDLINSIMILQIILGGNVHPQPGPNSKEKQNFQPRQNTKSREHFLLLQHTMEEHDFDIFTISETWLDSSVDSQVMRIPGFAFFHQDRGEHKSGGLAVYIKDTFRATLLKDVSGISDEKFPAALDKSPSSTMQINSYLHCL
ncbi:unnamed protein product [Pocillopora meandrina]|uniref:Uncharacterized protein n=1 Tax=Pocillopora meandrina TaxID=46732 RepID=A0AAU9XNN3_9CNID|nr:unnamed protein product [Pocillopora meandrina]